MLPPDVAQDRECVLQRMYDLVRSARSARIRKLRQQQRVDPLGVGVPPDLPGDFWLDVSKEGKARAIESDQLAVVGQRKPVAFVAKRMEILLADRRVLMEWYASNMRDHGRGTN